MLQNKPEVAGPSNWTTDELIAALQAAPDDQSLWEEFFERLGYLVRTQMRLYAQDLMDQYQSDILQEASIKIICNFHRLEPNRYGLQTYVQKMVRSCIGDFRRSLKNWGYEESASHAILELQRSETDQAKLVDLWTDISRYFPSAIEREIVLHIWRQESILEIQTALKRLKVTEHQIKRVRARLNNLLSNHLKPETGGE